MKTITAFMTEDGRIYQSEVEAQRHEIELSKHAIIDQFLASKDNPYTSIPQKGISRQSIIGWELWKKNNDK